MGDLNMIANNFKTCNHTPDNENPIIDVIDWRECMMCVDETVAQLIIARAYLEEIAKADFNDSGDCIRPFKEPVQGRSFQQIAATGFGASS